MRRKIISLTSVIIILHTGFVFAKVGVRNYCGKKYPDVCVAVEEKEDEAVFFFIWPYQDPATVTVKLNCKNASSDERQPFTTVVTASGKSRLFKIKRLDPNKPWRYNFQYRFGFGSPYIAHEDDYLYRLPYALGSSYEISQGHFGIFSHQSPREYAIDIRMPEGTAIHAAREGKVVQVESNVNSRTVEKDFNAPCNFINILHSDYSIGHYAHLRKGGVMVKIGDVIKRGQMIGSSGCTGFCSIPHLHFGVYKAVTGYDWQTLPFAFITDLGQISDPKQGASYKAVE